MCDRVLRLVTTVVICLAVFAFVSGSFVLAQQSLTLRIDRVDGAAFPQVTVYLTVRDANGVPVRDLTAQSFDVSEDRTLKSRTVSKVETLVDLNQPIAVILALDSSGSMAGKPLADAKAGAIRLLDRLGAGDSAALLAFSDNVNLDEPFPRLDPAREFDFTKDKAPLYKLVDGLNANGNTSLYDAAYKAVRLAAQQPAGNRAVLLLSDGRDEVAGGQRGSGSRVANEDTAIREANRANIPVFTIGLGSQIDEPYLKRLALETGGAYQPAPDSAQLGQLFQNVADLLKQQYRVAYASAVSPDGQKHQVLVTVKVNETTVFDEAQYGPVPLSGAPAPQIATPTSIPIVTETATAAVPPTATPVPPAPPEPKTDWTGLMIGGGAAVLLLVAGMIMLARRKKPAPVARCMNCGRALPSADAPCPSCGYKGREET